MIEALLSSGIGYLLGKIWGTVSFIIQKREERKDRQMDFEHEKNLHNQEVEMFQIQANHQDYMETKKTEERSEMAWNLLQQKESEAEAESRSKDYLAKVEILKQDSTTDVIKKAAGWFRIVVGSTSAIYMYFIGGISIVMCLEIFEILDKVIFTFEWTKLDLELKRSLISTLNQYSLFPLHALNIIFNTCIGIVTFYFGTTHASKHFRG